MRIGELAQKSGVSRDTIRFYERNGLIASTVEDSETKQLPKLQRRLPRLASVFCRCTRSRHVSR